MENNDEILAEFILEAREILDLLDGEFISLEQSPDDKKLIGNIFRALHTLKGSSGFFAFKRLEKISHAGESLLGKIRDGQISLDPEKTNRLLDTVDVLRIIIEGIEKSNSEPAGDDQKLIEQLQALAKVQSQPVQSQPVQQQENAIQQAEPDVEIEVFVEPPVSMKVDIPAPTNDVAVAEKVHDISAPVKVNLDTLDRLMNLTSEMVLARNRLLPFANNSKDLSFSQTVRSIDLLTLELQERMMKMRMQPISYVWSKFSRLVRDIAQECHKKVNLIQIGSETELDRALLDAIRDPLIHILRNSIDHSIEIPEIRKSKGKPETGNIQLRAFHQNGMVLIEIADDGAGINYEGIRQRAVERKLISSQEASGLAKEALIDLIFLPGFSTKEKVSSLSGRGVGMDVVKNNITNVGGSIEISSEVNAGTTIKLKIPLTLAIMPALLVGSEDQTYAIPQNRIIELVRLDPNATQTPFEDFYGTPVYRLRENLIPVLNLSDELKLKKVSFDKTSSINLVVAQSEGVQFGIIVDTIFNIQDVVVKPLGPLLNNLPKYAGATILGSGRVSLIVDVDGIASESGLIGKAQPNIIAPALESSQILEGEMGMLLFELNGLSRIAAPLESIEHILMLSEDQFQENGNKEVVYYQDQLMHVIRLEDYVSGCTPSDSSGQAIFPALTCHINHKTYALIVKQVFDIIQVPTKMHELSSPQRGIEGCVIYKDEVINVLDLEEVLAMHNAHDSSTFYPQIIDIQGVLD